MLFKITRIALVGCSLLISCRTSHAPPSGSTPESAEATLPKVSVTEVATFVQKKSATLVDANGSDTRHEFGVVPGAILLSSSKNYDFKELPASKSEKLVFYCGGLMCRASDAAAERAAKAGYTDVNVMREGIKGWKNAGQPTEAPRS
jgi:rhodanese-related sulfurtransferase